MKRAMTCVFSIALGGCGFLPIHFEASMGEHLLPGNPLQPALVGEPLEPIVLDISEALSDGQLDLVRGVFVDSIELQITSSGEDGGGDFSFLESLDIFISASGDSSLPRIPVAAATNPEGDQKILLLQGDPEINLKDYLLAGMRIEMEVTGVAPAIDTAFTGTVQILVEIF